MQCNLIGFSMSFSDLPDVVERTHPFQTDYVDPNACCASYYLTIFCNVQWKVTFVNAFQRCKGCLDITWTNHKRSVQCAAN